MTKHIFNLCSTSSGPYSPFRRANYNIYAHDLNPSNPYVTNSSSQLYHSFQDFLSNSSNERLVRDNSLLHVFYEPGRIYPDVPFDLFESSIIQS